MDNDDKINQAIENYHKGTITDKEWKFLVQAYENDFIEVDAISDELLIALDNAAWVNEDD